MSASAWREGTVDVEDITTFGPDGEAISWECRRCGDDGNRSNQPGASLTARQLGRLVAEEHGVGRCRR